MGIRLVESGAVGVMVADVDRAVRFYVEALGFDLRERGGDHAVVELPGLRIRLARGGDPGWKRGHAFPVSFALDVERLEGAMLVLKERGVPFAPDVAERDGERIAFFTDPDGTPLYLRQTNP